MRMSMMKMNFKCPPSQSTNHARVVVSRGVIAVATILAGIGTVVAIAFPADITNVPLQQNCGK
jgi:hypothetical protein